MSQTTALLLTLLIEVPIVVGIARLRRWLPGGLGLLALVAVGATLMTHPLLWMWQAQLGGMTGIVLAEVAIALVEGVAYAWGAGLGWWRGLVVSLVANGASFGTGLLLAGAL
jgi:hypothetical protein